MIFRTIRSIQVLDGQKEEMRGPPTMTLGSALADTLRLSTTVFSRNLWLLLSTISNQFH